MIKQERPPFVPLAPDIDDHQLEQLAREKGVGVLARPAKVQPERNVRTPAIPTTPQPLANDDRGATPRSRMKTVNLELPDYVWTELKIRAVQRQTSLRHVVMQALLADGITIAEVDVVEDGRRLRGSAIG